MNEWSDACNIPHGRQTGPCGMLYIADAHCTVNELMKERMNEESSASNNNNNNDFQEAQPV